MQQEVPLHFGNAESAEPHPQHYAGTDWHEYWLHPRPAAPAPLLPSSLLIVQVASRVHPRGVHG